MKVVVRVPHPPEFFFHFRNSKKHQSQSKRDEHKEMTNNIESRRTNNAQKRKEGKRHPLKAFDERV